MNNNILFKLEQLKNDIIKVNINLAKYFKSIDKAVYLQALITFYIYRYLDKNGYMYLTKNTIEDETTLSRFKQDKFRKELEKEGLLETKIFKVNGSPTLHYKINIEKYLKLIDKIYKGSFNE